MESEAVLPEPASAAGTDEGHHLPDVARDAGDERAGNYRLPYRLQLDLFSKLVHPHGAVSPLKPRRCGEP